jgi:hypothetical protein
LPFQRGPVPWGRWIIEFLLILGSVYLAVFLESASQARGEQAAARTALGQLLGELREDHTDFVRIIGIQEGLHQHYLNLGRWLDNPGSYPADSVGDALSTIGSENSTLFARRASWNTMISAGQLADLDAPELVLQLGQLYETFYDRIDYNSRFYDEELNAELRATPAIRWNRLDTRPLTTDAADLEELQYGLERVHITWNVWYRDLLIDYEGEVLDAIAAVEAYLGDEAG